MWGNTVGKALLVRGASEILPRAWKTPRRSGYLHFEGLIRPLWGLSPLRGADGQVDATPKWRNGVGLKPILHAFSRMTSPLKRE